MTVQQTTLFFFFFDVWNVFFFFFSSTVLFGINKRLCANNNYYNILFTRSSFVSARAPFECLFSIHHRRYYIISQCQHRPVEYSARFTETVGDALGALFSFSFARQLLYLPTRRRRGRYDKHTVFILNRMPTRVFAQRWRKRSIIFHSSPTRFTCVFMGEDIFGAPLDNAHKTVTGPKTRETFETVYDPRTRPNDSDNSTPNDIDRESSYTEIPVYRIRFMNSRWWYTEKYRNNDAPKNVNSYR